MTNRGPRDTLFYLLTIGGFSALIYAVLQAGKQLEHTATISANGNAWQDFLAALQAGLHAPLTLLLAQMAVILIVAQAVGKLFQKLGQPAVVGEMAAGIGWDLRCWAATGPRPWPHCSRLGRSTI